MPQYRYESLSATGDANRGVLTAPDRATALRQLVDRGETATELEPISDGEAKAAPKPKAKPKPVATSNGVASDAPRRPALLGRRDRPTLSKADMANLIREIATALEAGLPMMQALRTVRRQVTGPAMPAILDHIIERVEGGAPLHQAAREYGPPFDELIVGMLRAADASGEMSSILHQLADLLDRSVELKREVMGATMYPAIVFGLVIISVIILVTTLVPRLIQPLSGSIVMPLPTQILIDISNFFKSYWIWCVLALIGMIIGFRAWVGVPANRLRWDRFLLRAPLFGRLLRDIAVARFTRTLGTLTSSGLPILEALKITRGVLGNAALQEAIDQVQERVTGGKALADPLERSGLFPPLLVQIVNLGERSGKLESMLMHAANAFDRQVNNSLKLFTKVLPPVLLIFIAALAGFVLAAILLPLLDLQSNFG